MIDQPRLIPNTHLRRSDVPDVDLQALESSRWLDPSDTRWQQVWHFALTFDGYRYFGDDIGAPERLAVFDNSIRDAFFGGRLPTIDLALLRACLFYEARRWAHASQEGPDEREKGYLQALLTGVREAIR